MPYVKEEIRTKYNNTFWKLREAGGIASAGELNYLISTICKHYLFTNQESYEVHNAIVGALECAKQEYVWRMVNPYEDEKIKENGDVY